jgi:hypothetical protein
MLAVPYVAGLIIAGYRWPDVPLGGAWLAGYLFSYYVFQAARSRRPGRYRAQLVVYGSIAIPLTAVVVAARPGVLWYAPAYIALLAVNLWYAIRRRERSLANDFASVLQSCLIVLVMATIAGHPASVAVDAFVVCVAYFAGTVFYVKTMIRERGNPVFRWWSAGYHAGALAIAAWISPWAGGLFAWLLVRALVVPALGWTPKRVGIVEMVNCVLLLGCIALL